MPESRSLVAWHRHWTPREVSIGLTQLLWRSEHLTPALLSPVPLGSHQVSHKACLLIHHQAKVPSDLNPVLLDPLQSSPPWAFMPVPLRAWKQLTNIIYFWWTHTLYAMQMYIYVFPPPKKKKKNPRATAVIPVYNVCCQDMCYL